MAAVSAFSCNKKAEEKKVSAIDSAIIQLPDSAYVSVNKSFLDAFKSKEQQEYVFTPPTHITQPIRNAVHVGSQYLPLFPSTLKIGNAKKPEVFAVEKFKIDKNTTALITQNPGDFALSSLNLMLYNHQAEAVSAMLEVADKTDDKRFKSRKQTVLVRDSGRVKGLMWYTTSILPVDENDPTHPMTTEEYFSITIKNGKIDTAKASPEEINRYKAYLK